MMKSIVLLVLLQTVAVILTDARAGHGTPSREEEQVNDLGQPVYDLDTSWAITTDHLSNTLGDKQALYDEYMQGCREAAGDSAATSCGVGEKFRLKMDRLQPMSMRNYTQNGFVKIKAPKAMFDLIQEFWRQNKDKQEIEWGKTVNTYHNLWDAPPYLVNIQEPKLGGGGKLQQKIWSEARNVLQEWTGMHLAPCSMWGIRSYKNNSILAPHVDRNPLVTSCIINVDQDVDEDWPLEVYGHDGKPYNVTMEPGDMVLYESHSIIHGRPFPMRGRFFANIFIHFEPLGNYRMDEKNPDIVYSPESQESLDDGLPPYILPGSPWAKEWKEKNPKGWKLLHDNAGAFAQEGNMEYLMNLAIQNPDKLHEADHNGWTPLHMSARAGQEEAFKFLLDAGADPNIVTNKGRGYSARGLVKRHHGENHPLYAFLDSLGAIEVGPDL